MAEHTPKPWKQIEYDDWLYIGGEDIDIIQYEPVNEPYNYCVENAVCVMDHVDSMTARGYANANLIAAAPDLLEACEYIDKWLRSMDLEYMPDFDWQQIEPVAAAIAKARGE